MIAQWKYISRNITHLWEILKWYALPQGNFYGSSNQHVFRPKRNFIDCGHCPGRHFPAPHQQDADRRTRPDPRASCTRFYAFRTAEACHSGPYHLVGFLGGLLWALGRGMETVCLHRRRPNTGLLGPLVVPEGPPHSLAQGGSIKARHPGESQDPVHAKETSLDAGYVIPDLIRDRHDDKNSPATQLVS